MTAPDTAQGSTTKTVFRLLLVLAVILAVNRLAAWAIDPTDFAPGHVPASDPMVYAAAALYALLLSLPFVPGVEIGLALLSVFGPPVVPLVYGATLLGLLIAFGMGRLIPMRVMCALLRRIGLERGAAACEALMHVPAKDRLSHLLSGLSAPLARVLLRYPELTLMLLINLPGNTLIGGGGGIAMAVGMSRLMSFPRFAAASAIAIAPVPAAVYFFGLDPFA